jgi:gliding motility-associated-like protein
LTTTYDSDSLSGVTPGGEYAAGTDVSDFLVNHSRQVQAVTYNFKARIRDDRVGNNFGYCDQGKDTSITIYVNPTPRLSVDVADTIYCDSSTVNISVDDDLLNVLGTKVYELTTTYDSDSLSGVTASGEYAAGTDISDQLVNHSIQVQTVTYNFKARIRDPRGPATGYCDQGKDTSITIYVNPTPRLSVDVADTIYCDSSTVNISVTDQILGVLGTKVYELTTTYDSDSLSGVTPDGEYAAGTDISDQLINHSRQVQTVTYNFKARIRDDRVGNNFGYCDQGKDTSITIYVNPTPRLSVDVADTIFCDSSTVNISVDDDLLSVLGTKVYELTTTYDSDSLSGVTSSGEYAAGTDISDQLINHSRQVQTVTYNFKARIRDPRGPATGYCDQGKDTSITIYVNPTPRLSVDVADTIYCDSSTVNISVDDDLLNVLGTKVYELTTTFDSDSLSGVTPSGEYAAGTDISDLLVNHSRQVQTVTYNFKARIRDDRVGNNFGYCDQGRDTSITIYVNPTPRLSVDVADTIYCDSSTVNISVDDDLLNVLGTKVYELTTTYDSDSLSGVTASGEYAAGTDISDQLINHSRQVQAVTYNFKARIRDPRGPATGYCDQGKDTSITIYVNPTPRLSVDVADTIYCDSSTVNISVDDDLLNVLGTKVYELTTTFDSDSLSGVTPSGEYAAGTDISDLLVNHSRQVQTVTYNFKARIRDDRVGNNFGYCDQGKDTSITIYVNPTPRLSVDVADTIFCDSSTVNISVDDDLLNVLGTKVYELTTTYDSDSLSGVTASGEYAAGTDISDFLVNHSRQVQAVTYNFKARIRDPRGPATGYCDQGKDTSITIYVNPTPRLSVDVADTIFCDSSTVNISVDDDLLNVLGTKVYELTTTFDSDSLSGVTPSGEYAAGTDISDQLINLSRQVQTVTYNFKARIRDDRVGNNFGYCDQGRDTTITIYVNPTPRLSVDVADTIYCDSSTVNISVDDDLLNVLGTKVYELTTTFDSDSLSGVTPSGEYAAGTDISDQLINHSRQVQTVTYNFKARIRDDRVGNNFGYCDQGKDTSITIYVNPTPRLSVDVADTIFCDSSTVNISVDDDLLNVLGTKVYELTTTFDSDSLSGVTPSGEYAAGTDISDLLINHSRQVQTVTYNFKARIRDDRVGNNFGYCDQGKDTSITIYVNPTPRLSVDVADTIFCDSSTVNISVDDDLLNVLGTKVYELTTTFDSDSLSGVTPSGEYAAGTDISDQLINHSRQVQAVTYNFKARIRDDRVGNNFGYCDQGKDTSITIYVNPTPRLSVDVADTIYCDSSTVNISVDDDLLNVLGTKVYELTTTFDSDSLSGVTPSGEYAAGTDISDLLRNHSRQVQTVTYNFKARIRDDRVGNNFGYCDQGKDTSITIYVNPIPRLHVSIDDTIYCDSSSYLITISDLLLNVEGVKVYDLETSASDPRVTGYQPDGEYAAGLSITDTLINNTYKYQTVTYRFRARIWDDRPGHGNYCDRGTDTTIIIYLNPTPRISVSVPDTLYCNEEPVDFTISTKTWDVIGATAYDLDPTFDPVDISGVSAAITYPIDYFSDDDDFTDTITNSHNDQVRVIEYRFRPRILDIRPSGYDCDYGIDTIIRIYVAATLNDSLESTRVWIGGHDLRCNFNQMNYNGADSAGINLYRWGGFGYLTDFEYYYDWQDSIGHITTSRNVDRLRAGWYYVDIIDDEGCNTRDSIELTEPDLYQVIIDSITPNQCGGGSEAIIHTIVSGGVQGYDYTWTRGEDEIVVSKEQSPTGLIEGFYYLDAYDTNKCFTVADTLFVDPLRITPSIALSRYGDYQVACYGDSNGSIRITYVEGGTGKPENFTYEWRRSLSDSIPFAISRDIYDLAAGDYYLTIYDSLNCRNKFEDPQVLNHPDPIEFTLVETSLYGGIYNIRCYDSLNGYIRITDNAGGSTRTGRIHNYKWTTTDGIITDPDEQDQENLPAGTYYVYVSDSVGAPYNTSYCNLTDSFTLIQPPQLTLQDTISDYNGYAITCADSATGWIAIDVSGGYYHAQDPYSYEWSYQPGGTPIAGTDSVYGLNAGEYQLIVTDSLGCPGMWTFNLDEPEQLMAYWQPVDYHGVNITCFGLSDGAIDTTIITGGVESYSYNWTRVSDGWSSTDAQPAGLIRDTYTLQVTDNNGCIDYFDSTLIQPELLIIGNITTTEPSCAGASNGKIWTDTISGGTLPYTILWNTPRNDTTKDVLDSVPQGIYTIQVWDVNNCYATDSTLVDEPEPFIGSIDTISLELYNNQMISCFGESDAVLGVTEPEGGTRPYQFWWYYGPDSIEFSTDSVVYARPAGYHRVIMRDAFGCFINAEIVVTQPENLRSQSFVSDAVCYNEASGSIDFHMAGGTPPYTYGWLSGQTVPNITGLLAGEYYVVVQDTNRCIYDTTLVVGQPDSLEANPQFLNPGCPDSYDGSIWVSPSGGVPPYNITWSDGPLNEVRESVGPGLYVVEVMDDHFCTTRDTIILISDADNCLKIPTAFTPNADGYNDKWEIEGMIYYPDAIVRIFNRWGELVYETDNYADRPWDGSYKGLKVPVDSYHFIISFTNGIKEITGQVTVIK